MDFTTTLIPLTLILAPLLMLRKFLELGIDFLDHYKSLWNRAISTVANYG